ncbi:hypothetical protein B5P44_01030 [Mycobacterium sp. CBMA 213]|uniref:Uncharacterized protein n=1 Tax=Mycolicibacterium sp. CBMA 213 TaxID=1968788 RepID=A0A343VRJ7_9MYCO|nr:MULTISPECIES: hypothetical protein [unclassified Mycolicibacterium]AVN58521.1 hypothetical protein B5P44_p00226 [Mycolicibacterium sp. CBMA 213]MUL61166.1 hypothetical protein [Mycolicibacterium sp. CBMA 335]MUM03404.1 hypothetical protein [Mycolicibacterium sp. CBMA 213]
MTEIHVKVVIDTDHLRWWAAKHRGLGHESVAAVLSAAADHYENTTTAGDVDPPAPSYPASLDSTELKHWANWHIDRGPTNVAHTLFAAAEQRQSQTTQHN